MLNILAQAQTPEGFNYILLGLVVLIIMALLFLVLVVAELWLVFKKAGKPGWAAIIPFYNGWVLAEIAGHPGWLGLLMFASLIPISASADILNSIVSLIGFVAIIVVAAGVSKNFGKSGAFSLLLIFLPLIGYGILGFGSARHSSQPAANVSDKQSPSKPAN